MEAYVIGIIAGGFVIGAILLLCCLRDRDPKEKENAAPSAQRTNCGDVERGMVILVGPDGAVTSISFTGGGGSGASCGAVGGEGGGGDCGGD